MIRIAIIISFILCSCQKELDVPIDTINLTYKFEVLNGLYITAMLDKPAREDTKILVQYNTGVFMLGVWLMIRKDSLKDRVVALYSNTVHYDDSIVKVIPESGTGWVIKY